MLACAKIGAAHTVVFGGFSAEALSERINDARAKVLITADGGWRRGKHVGLKHHADEAVARPRRSWPPDRRRATRRRRSHMVEGRDHWWHEVVERQSDRLRPGTGRLRAPALPALHVGDDGQAEGHRAHDAPATSSGASFTHAAVFDIKPDDVYWCAADIGWVTGHSYIVYGPLANATTGILYEGAPDTPAWDRWWQIVEDYKVTILYTAPTAIRSFMKQGRRVAGEARPVVAAACSGRSASRSTPRRGSGTRRTSEAAKAPIVDTWWQTETGSILISPLPGVTTTKPGSATFPLPGHRGGRGGRGREPRSPRAEAATSS